MAADHGESDTGSEGAGKGGERLGLALSGGGFRAAFFHLGVLARLAELGILRKVEVISTVSGGSVIGAAYYLKLKNLLEQDGGTGEPDDAAYVDLVKELDASFCKAVSNGIRGRIFANFVKNLEMLLPVRPGRTSYSRTDRIGDMFDRYFYKEIFWARAPRGRPERRTGICFSREKQVELRDLLIRPPGLAAGTKLEEANRTRKARIPELVINATTLNTGHAWRFEAIRMGEHPDGSDADGEDAQSGTPEQAPGPDDVDGNRILSPGYFRAAGMPPDERGKPIPEEQQDFPLGLAVAASAAVPGAFPPLPISRMYANARVQLVDGGVVDNQGIQALRDHRCDCIIVSDGSGQMADKARPGTVILSVLSRASGVLADRVRDLQLSSHPDHSGDDPEHVTENRRVVHLRRGLKAPAVESGGAWRDLVLAPAGTPVPGEKIHPRALDALSKIRTDLDTFSREEADALACCGYLSIDEKLADCDLREPPGKLPEGDDGWSFLRVSEALEDGDPDLIAHLELGRQKFFRFLGPKERLWKWLKRIFAALVVIALVVLVWHWPEIHLRWPDLAVLGWIIAALVAAAAVPAILLALYRLIRGSWRCLKRTHRRIRHRFRSTPLG